MSQINVSKSFDGEYSSENGILINYVVFFPNYSTKLERKNLEFFFTVFNQTISIEQKKLSENNNHEKHFNEI